MISVLEHFSRRDGIMNDKQQRLLVEVMNLFAAKFNKKVVLRGGMVLRVLGCERLTNDLDYIFMPYKSQNDIIKEILTVLNEIENAKIKYSLNSKCLRIILKVNDISIQIEAKVAIEAPTQILSTKELSAEYGFPPCLIQVLDYPVALANKMAAWNERRLIRDIYDIWFFLKMDIKPDTTTLQERLKKCLYSRLIKTDDYFIGEGVIDFYDFILTYVNKLSDKMIMDSLNDYLNKNDIIGLSMKFRAEFAKLKNDD